jgi:hypothetical protein
VIGRLTKGAAAMQLTDLMYRPGLMNGERVLVTGGGTGLGKVMAEAFLLLGRASTSSAGGAGCCSRPPTS